MLIKNKALPLRSLAALLRRRPLARELVEFILASRCITWTFTSSTMSDRRLIERVVTPHIDGKTHGVERRCDFSRGVAIACWDAHYVSGICVSYAHHLDVFTS